MGVVPVGGESLRRSAVCRGAGEVIDRARIGFTGAHRVELVVRVEEGYILHPSNRIVSAAGVRFHAPFDIKRSVLVRYRQGSVPFTIRTFNGHLINMAVPCLVGVRLKVGGEVVVVVVVIVYA